MLSGRLPRKCWSGGSNLGLSGSRGHDPGRDSVILRVTAERPARKVTLMPGAEIVGGRVLSTSMSHKPAQGSIHARALSEYTNGSVCGCPRGHRTISGAARWAQTTLACSRLRSRGRVRERSRPAASMPFSPPPRSNRIWMEQGSSTSVSLSSPAWLGVRRSMVRMASARPVLTPGPVGPFAVLRWRIG